MAFRMLFDVILLIVICGYTSGNAITSDKFLLGMADLKHRYNTPQETTTRFRRSKNNSSNTQDCLPSIQNGQDYYSQQIIRDDTDRYWVELRNTSKRHELSAATGGIMTVNLTFGFPFYGHVMKHVFISTAGIMTMRPKLGKTHNINHIAPYYTHFNFNLSKKSAIYTENQDDKLIVEWRDVFQPNVLQADQDAQGPFKFETIIYRNGSIMFLYKKIPSIMTIGSSLIGLVSILDIDIAGTKVRVSSRTVNIDPHTIQEGTVVIFSPFTDSDMEGNDSQTCVTKNTSFYCRCCKIKRQCSEEVNRQLQNWVMTFCSSESIKCTHEVQSQASQGTTLEIITIIVLSITVIGLIFGWLYYAHTHPVSRSGTWLLEKCALIQPYNAANNIWLVSIAQSNFDGSNIFRTMEICSRDGLFEPVRFNHGARSGSKWRHIMEICLIFNKIMHTPRYLWAKYRAKMVESRFIDRDSNSSVPVDES